MGKKIPFEMHSGSQKREAVLRGSTGWRGGNPCTKVLNFSSVPHTFRSPTLPSVSLALSTNSHLAPECAKRCAVTPSVVQRNALHCLECNIRTFAELMAAKRVFFLTSRSHCTEFSQTVASLVTKETRQMRFKLDDRKRSVTKRRHVNGKN